jgi:acid phosphatase
MFDAAGIAVSGATASWSSSDNAVATVSSGGVVTGKAAGTATITATASGVGAITGTAVVTVSANDVRFSNVFVVGMLQKDNSAIFGGTVTMPFLDSLSKAGARAANYFGNTQPSIGNFFTLVAGDTITNNDTSSVVFSGANLVRQLVAAGKTWKSYAENLPNPGYIGPDAGLYIRRHNVFTLLSDVVSSPTKAQNLVPLTQLSADITAGALPNFGMIIPNDCNNTNTSNTNPACGLANADAWLRTNLTPLLATPAFQAGGNGLLIIVFDRSGTSTVHGGGQVSWVAVGPRVKSGYVSPAPTATAFFQHQSTLRLIQSSLGLTGDLGLTATAPSMSEFFTTP